MKKIVILLMFIITYSNVIGQSLNDFRNAWQVNKLKYDEEFNPIISFVFQNISNKPITTIEVDVIYDSYDFSNGYKPQVLQASIKPNQIHVFTIKLNKDPYDRKPRHLYLRRIRYSDGSICD